MMWTQFFEAFLVRFVSYSLRDQMFEEFDHLEWGSMTIFKYETHFHTLSKYSVASISIEFEWIKKFIKGLYDNYHLCTTYMIVSRDLF